MLKTIFLLVVLFVGCDIHAQSTRKLKALQGVQSKDDVARLQSQHPKWNIRLSELTDSDVVDRPVLYQANQGEMFSHGSEGVVYKIMEHKKLMVVIGEANPDFDTANSKIELGRKSVTQTTTGGSGRKTFGFMDEYGIGIVNTVGTYDLQKINFHLRYNTMDSVKFRVKIYTVEEGLPGVSLESLEIVAYKNQDWVEVVMPQALRVNQDIIVSYQVVETWMSSRGENRLFFTHGQDYFEGGVYSRGSSGGQWSNKTGIPIVLYVEGEKRDNRFIN